MADELQAIMLIIEIEPVALGILEQQAAWQGLTLDQLAASYIARCAAVIENQYGNALVADAFDSLAERNKPKQQRPEPEPVYKRLARLEHQAGAWGYNTRVDNGQIDLWSSREPKPGIMGELHTFPFNDDGIQAAFAWLERAKDRPAE
jgi:hypothetical protein